MFNQTNGKTVFIYGRDNYAKAEEAAAKCGCFTFDCEEECLADEEVSCYNCRYRRWTAESFECLKGGVHYE
jgi:hypothetical protein